MKTKSPESMSVDELWEAHEQIGRALLTKIRSEQEKLQRHLEQLQSGTLVGPALQSSAQIAPAQKERRPYPKVKPKYRSLKNPADKWSGRGKRPKWLMAELKDGKSIADFLIDKKNASKRPGSRSH